MTASNLKHARTPVLDIAYEESGQGVPVLLMHGWPYDPRCYDAMISPLMAAGCRVIVPYLRGFGSTRFLSPDTPRSGQQAALGNDLREFMDALNIPRAILGGFDWGGRAACIVAALWPERARGLVTCNGYNIQDIVASAKPAAPTLEHRFWYQYYFQTARGRAGLAENRRDLAKLLWRLWSPHWVFDDATFARSAASFDNPDFVDVVIHSYRHRYGYVPGDPALEPIERLLAAQPKISVPAINLHGEDDGVGPAATTEHHAHFFTGAYRRQVIPRVGHNPPQEAPEVMTAAVLELMRL